MIVIKKETIVQTCYACPSQWEARTTDDDSVYIRVRHGGFRLEISGETFFSGHPDGVDGVMNTDDMIKYVNENNKEKLIIV